MSSVKRHKNEKPMRYSKSIKELDLNLFPLIDDFEIIIRDFEKCMGLHLEFYSSCLGAILASFEWWDNVERDLVNMSIDEIPIGSIDNPYYDLDQEWEIVIWEADNFVYIMEGEESGNSEFLSWFKVKKVKYIEEWERILKIFKEGKEIPIFEERG